MKKIAITTGDPCGIGPEITTKAFSFFNPEADIAYIIYGTFFCDSISENVEKISSPDEATIPGKIYYIEIAKYDLPPGTPSAKSGEEALLILDRCSQDLIEKKIDAVVTCPICKAAIQQIDSSFIGHTEYFADKAGIDQVIMSFWGPKFNLALLTTHLPITNVCQELNEHTLENKLRLIDREIRKIIPAAKVAILGINPHAGEEGAFGTEDILIENVLKKINAEGINIDGPYPADTFFTDKATKYDCIISPYHDQGLVPFKMTSMGDGVNVTLGLPFIRTSVDHGTAFDIAGKGKASEQSLLAAIHKATAMLKKDNFHHHSQYNWFAKYYDSYMDHVDYESWVEFILSHYTKIRKNNPEKILELACGTANVSTKLVKKDLSVDASDKSSEMLKIAAQKNFIPNLYCRDMLDPILPEHYDLILLLFDSINYLLDTKEISKLLINIANGLKKGGICIFDISTLENCEKNFDGYVNLDDQRDRYMIHQSDFDHDSMIQTTNLTLFVKTGYQYERKDEIHKQRIYYVDKIVDLIEKSPLRLLSINSIGHPNNLIDFGGLDTSFSRLFFIVEK